MGFITPYGLVKRVRSLFLFETDDAAPPPAPPALVQAMSATTINGMFQSINLNSPVQAGNTLIFGFLCSSGLTISNGTDNEGNIYTLDFTAFAGFLQCYFFRCSNIQNAPTSISFDSDQDTLTRIYAWEYSGLSNVTPFQGATTEAQPNGESLSASFAPVVENNVNCTMAFMGGVVTPAAIAPTVQNTNDFPNIQFAFTRIASAISNACAADWIGQGALSPTTYTAVYNHA